MRHRLLYLVCSPGVYRDISVNPTARQIQTYRAGFGSLFWLSESETMSRIRRVENELPSPLRYINRSNTIGNVSHYA